MSFKRSGLSNVLSKKRDRNEIGKDSFDVWVPQNDEYNKDELSSKMARLTLDTDQSERKEYTVYHYQRIDTKQRGKDSVETSQMCAVKTLRVNNFEPNIPNMEEARDLDFFERLCHKGVLYTENREFIHPLCERLISRHLLSPDFCVYWKDRPYPYLYALIDEEKWIYALNLLNNGAHSTFVFSMDMETPAALFMKKIKRMDSLSISLQSILTIIKKQVNDCIEYKTQHPEDTSIIIPKMDESNDVYDVYLSSSMTTTYNKPDNALLSEDLMNDKDYEMDDSSVFYVFEEDEHAHDDDEDSQNRSETWEYGSDHWDDDYVDDYYDGCSNDSFNDEGFSSDGYYGSNSDSYF